MLAQFATPVLTASFAVMASSTDTPEQEQIPQRSDLVCKPGTKSELWSYFGLKKGADGKGIDNGDVFCRFCPEGSIKGKVKAKTGNTSNLKSHLKCNHKTVYAALPSKLRSGSPADPGCSSEGPVQQSITSSFPHIQPYNHQGKRYKELTDAVAYFICKDGLPIHSVEKKGFLRMMKTFDCRYEVPSRSQFSRSIIPSLYASTKEKVAQKISTIKFFACTTDMWSGVSMSPHMSLTVHFIDEAWHLESLALSACYLPNDHTAEVLAEGLKESMQEWSLESKNLVCLTTDSGANIVAAASQLKWTRLSCFGHNLHLAVKKALEDRRCERVLAVARKAISAFSYSWKRRRDLGKAQTTLKIPQHSLISVSECFCT